MWYLLINTEQRRLSVPGHSLLFRFRAVRRARIVGGTGTTAITVFLAAACTRKPTRNCHPARHLFQCGTDPCSPVEMSFRTTESWRCVNGTCAEKVEPFPPLLSSTFALILLGVAIVGIVALSLTTHHCHKGKMKRRKIQRAQEEYERDQLSPVPAARKADRCVIARPAAGCTEPPPGRQDTAELSTQTGAVEAGVLEAVAVSR